MIRVLRTLAGGESSRVELVELDGERYVLKTSTAEEIACEREFLSILASHDMPVLRTRHVDGLQDDQLLQEYIEGSPTLADAMSDAHCATWGTYLRRLHDIPGTVSLQTWTDFVRSKIAHGAEKNRKKETDIQSESITTLLQELAAYAPARMSYIHGDAHARNVLVKDGRLYLFDKLIGMRDGDPLYDLALAATEFPGGLPSKAFIEGYARDFVAESPRVFRLYVLLRAFNRYPNKRAPHLKAIITALSEELR